MTGYTLGLIVERRIKQQIGKRPERAYVDKGYRGYDKQIKTQMYQIRQKKGVKGKIKKELKRRSVVEAIIGHLKVDGPLGRNWLKRALGYKINVLLSTVGQNLRGTVQIAEEVFISVSAKYANPFKLGSLLRDMLLYFENKFPFLTDDYTVMLTETQ